MHLRNSPICCYCEVGAFGRACIVAARLVDHLYPHRGDMVLFWSARWWVSSCTTCHSGPKQAAELEGAAALDRLADLLALPRLT